MPITGPGRPTWASRVKASPIDWHSSNQARPVSKGDVLMGSIMFRVGSQPSKMIEGLCTTTLPCCPPAGARQKNFRNHPSHPTTCRHVGTKFGQISARSKIAIGKPLICIGLASNGRGKFGGWFGAKGEGVWPTKKALQILDLQAIENRLCC